MFCAILNTPLILVSVYCRYKSSLAKQTSTQSDITYLFLIKCSPYTKVFQIKLADCNEIYIVYLLFLDNQ
jgi:hypothetical protein